MPASVAILPFPLNVAGLFGHGILRFIGHTDNETHTRLTRVSSSQAELFVCDGRIVDLRLKSGDMYSEVSRLIGSNTSLKRVLTFASFGGNRHKKLESVLRKLDTEDSRRALTLVAQLVSALMQNGRDIWESEELLDMFVGEIEKFTAPARSTAYPPDKLFLSFPFFKKMSGPPLQESRYGYYEVTLEEGRICQLQDQHICIVVGGPSSSGKSTLSASLVAEMRNCISSLQTRQSFANLKLTVGLANLDLGTPTAKAIEEGWATTSREKLISLKQPWNMELARKAQEEFLSSKKNYNITVGDLPGRITEETQLLAGTADAAIIISRDWKVAGDEWIPLMKVFGVHIISNIRSHKAPEKGNPESLITHWTPGERLSGEISRLNRSKKTWDSLIHHIIRFLLFDVLPKQFGK